MQTTTVPNWHLGCANREGLQDLHAPGRLVPAPRDQSLLVKLYDLRGHRRPSRKFLIEELALDGTNGSRGPVSRTFPSY